MSVFHLKYRPQLLEELDSKTVRETLHRLLASEDMPPVFLFCGPKGSGKTSAARIVAKVVNCERKKEGEACGKCQSCLSISRGNCLDIVEMDAASNRGIDDVRTLKEKIYLSPTQLKKKVFIIDEVHMMTKEAFNALLKLLEEPPAHTIFILCTTDPEKIPETVLSRLVRVNFMKGGIEEMKNSLSRVVKGEGLSLEPGILEMIIERSEGSFRNASKLLTELVVSCGKEINLDVVQKLSWFSFGGYDEQALAADLKAGKKKKILRNLEQLAEKGVDMVAFRQRLVVYFQEMLLRSYGVGVGEKQVEVLTEHELVGWLQLLILAGKQEKEEVVTQLPLELAVIEFLKNNPDVSEKELSDNEPKKQTEKEEDKKVRSSQVTVTLGQVEQGWEALLRYLKPKNHTVEAFLRAARPIRVEHNGVVVEVLYPFHKDKLEEIKNRKIVESALETILGCELQVRCILGKLKRSHEPVMAPAEEVPLSVVTPVASGGGADMYQIAKEIFG